MQTKTYYPCQFYKCESNSVRLPSFLVYVDEDTLNLGVLSLFNETVELFKEKVSGNIFLEFQARVMWRGDHIRK